MRPHKHQVCTKLDATGSNNRLSSSPGGASWSFEFRCPACGRTGRFNTNFLGSRVVVCDGIKFSKRKWDLELAVAEHDANGGRK